MLEKTEWVLITFHNLLQDIYVNLFRFLRIHKTKTDIRMRGSNMPITIPAIPPADSPSEK